MTEMDRDIIEAKKKYRQMKDDLAGEEIDYKGLEDVLVDMFGEPEEESEDGFQIDHELLGETVKETVKAVFEGGPGSGDFGHVGRPGMVGGSGKKGGTPAPTGTDLPLKMPSGEKVIAPKEKTVFPIKCDEFVTDETKEMVQNTLNRFPPEITDQVIGDIKINSGEGPEVMLEGFLHHASALFDPADKSVELFDANNVEGGRMQRSFAHEIGHGIMEVWWERADVEIDVAQRDHPEWFDRNGFMKPEYREEVNKAAPFYRLQQNFFGGWNAGEDGITEYSEAMTKQGQGRSETVAEMCKLMFGGVAGEKYLRERCKDLNAERLGESFIGAVKLLIERGKKTESTLFPIDQGLLEKNVIEALSALMEGGPGSGDFGHSGRPGLVGGSAGGKTSRGRERTGGQVGGGGEEKGLQPPPPEGEKGETPKGAMTFSRLGYKEQEKVKVEILTEWEDAERREMAIAAWQGIESGRELVLGQYDGDELIGIVSMTNPVDALVHRQQLAYVSFLATKRPGRDYGTHMLVQICKRAVAAGVGIELLATDEARPFYDKMGMTRIGMRKYAFTKEDANGFIRRIEGSRT